MGKLKLRKHINIPNFYSGQYHQKIFHDTYFSDCIFSFTFWQKSSILRISSKKFLSSKVFEDLSKFRRIFVFVFALFSEPEDSSSSSSVHLWSSLQHWVLTHLSLNSGWGCQARIQTGLGTLDAPESIALSHYWIQINLSLLAIQWAHTALVHDILAYNHDF